MLTELHSDDSVITKTTPEPDVGSTTSIRDTDIKLLSRTVTRCSVTQLGAEPSYTNPVSDIQDPIHIGERVTNTNLAQRLVSYEIYPKGAINN